MADYKRILIADDALADVGLIRTVLEDQGLEHEAAVVYNAEDALEYLFRRGKYRDRPEGDPDLVLLDLYLQKAGGLTILREIRADKRLKDIPVIVFSGSLNEDDKTESLSCGANDYNVKPVDYDQFSQAIKKMTEAYVR
jgi:two-component system, response regulator